MCMFERTSDACVRTSIFLLCVCFLCGMHLRAYLCALWACACVQPQTQCVSNQLCVWVELTAASWEGTSTSVYWTHTHTHLPPVFIRAPPIHTHTSHPHIFSLICFPPTLAYICITTPKVWTLTTGEKGEGKSSRFSSLFFNVSEYVGFIYLGINLHGYDHKMC